MHDKIMIVDGKVVLTGSFNWSNNAENENNENLLIITSTSLATTYENEFQKIWNTPSS
jgi:phosphatidylserine/phosphatidylglycerophosphate/cardiolipin synthase-like enzyme